MFLAMELASQKRREPQTPCGVDFIFSLQTGRRLGEMSIKLCVSSAQSWRFGVIFSFFSTQVSSTIQKQNMPRKSTVGRNGMQGH